MGRKKYLCYVRVSSASQGSHIAEQTRQLTEFVKERFDCSDSDIQVVTEIGSAFFARDKLLNTVLNGVREGRFGAVCVNYLDRLARSADSLSIIRHVCEWFGVPVIAANKTVSSDKAALEDLTNEIVSFLTASMNRLSSLRSVESRRVKVPDEVRERIIQEYESGVSTYQIQRDLERDEITSEKGKKITYSKVRQIIREHVRTNQTVDIPNKEKRVFGSDVLKEWADECCTFSSTDEGRCFTQLAYASFQRWADENVVALPSRREFVRRLKDEFELPVYASYGGYRCFKGMTLKALQDAPRPPRDEMREYLDRWTERLQRGN